MRWLEHAVQGPWKDRQRRFSIFGPSRDRALRAIRDKLALRGLSEALRRELTEADSGHFCTTRIANGVQSDAVARWRPATKEPGKCQKRVLLPGRVITAIKTVSANSTGWPKWFWCRVNALFPAGPIVHEKEI